MKTYYFITISLCLLLLQINLRGQGGLTESQKDAFGRQAAEAEERTRAAQSEGSIEGAVATLVILGGIAVLFANTHPRSYKKTEFERIPKLIVRGDLPLYKNRINEHWRGGFSYKIKTELLLIGKRGRFPHYGLYGGATFANNRYNLPFTQKQYYLSHTMVSNGEEGVFYPLNQHRTQENRYSKWIIFSDKSFDLGLSFKTFLQNGFFFDVGGVVKTNRKMRIEFGKKENYLQQGHQISANRFEDVTTVIQKPMLFNLQNSYVEFGVGKADGEAIIKLSTTLFQLDHIASKNVIIYHEDANGNLEAVQFTQKLGYSINLGIGFAL